MRGDGRSGLGSGGVGGGGLGRLRVGGMPPRREVLTTRMGILEINLSAVPGGWGESVESEKGGRSKWHSVSLKLKCAGSEWWVRTPEECMTVVIRLLLPGSAVLSSVRILCPRALAVDVLGVHVGLKKGEEDRSRGLL